MILFYALGGGWGHLKRVSVFALNQGINDFKVVTASPVAFHIYREDQVVLADRKYEQDLYGFAGFMDDLIRETDPERMIVDVFPNGILGELHLLRSKLPKDLLCRHMKWDAYRPKAVSGLQYETAYVLEELHTDQEHFIRQTCSEFRQTSLDYPLVPLEEDPFAEGPAWLVVHGSSGPELRALIAEAFAVADKEQTGPRLYVISDQDPGVPGLRYLGPVPASGFMEFADRIFTGAGFNIMHETKRFRDRQVILPFERRYDDQHLRMQKMRGL